MDEQRRHDELINRLGREIAKLGKGIEDEEEE